MRYAISSGCKGIGGDLSISSIFEAIKFVILSLPSTEKLKVRVYKGRK
jgi:hypothetical protein